MRTFILETIYTIMTNEAEQATKARGRTPASSSIERTSLKTENGMKEIGKLTV